MGKRIYLGTPYSHEDPNIQEYRYRIANAVAAKLMGDGHFVYSPISHTHEIAKAGSLPGNWEYWKGYCECFFKGWTEEMYVIMTDGWGESTGLTAEIKLAESLNIPITYIDPETFEFPYESAWTGYHDSNGLMIFIGDLLKIETEINLDLHGPWTQYRVTWGSEYEDEEKKPWLVYQKSKRGQVIPVGTNQWYMSVHFPKAMDSYAIPYKVEVIH